ncbi:hypothetical protein [Paenibacillus rhizophilus]|uniref:Uncharacterized protein n=1 Tax=Paenibacillus rhizophilus TaxID=1850366 RepID=A0A3N9P2H4_9BACL|nr:hypothetical protein [Paenibacillus rhizophilus]RQW09677.1 hypothetical protein EH198_18050 [Paenibacillus rhizophilus]
MINNPLWEIVHYLRKIGPEIKGKEMILSSSLSAVEQSIILEHYFSVDCTEQKSPNAEMWV